MMIAQSKNITYNQHCGQLNINTKIKAALGQVQHPKNSMNLAKSALGKINVRTRSGKIKLILY